MNTAPNTPLVPPEALTLADLRIPDTVEAWLAQLRDLTLLHIVGQDRSRLRIVSTLLHGNEPSSIRAMHRFLSAGQPPATDLWLLVGAVRAAVGPPSFGQRFVPGDGDLNRVWLPPFEGPRAEHARGLLECFAASGAEALLDLHNNTGHNPPYGVGPDDRDAALEIASLFGSLFVHSPLRMGTLMEAAAPLMPCATIECGRAGDPAADEVAFRGLSEFLRLPSLGALRGQASNVRVLGDPIRVTVAPGTRLAFGHEAQGGADLTLDPDIDRHNFQLLPKGELLGWVAGDALPLRAEGSDARDRSAEMFTLDGRELRSASEWMPVMMTTSAAAALSDCLFYAVHPRSEPQRA